MDECNTCGYRVDRDGGPIRLAPAPGDRRVCRRCLPKALRHVVTEKWQRGGGVDIYTPLGDTEVRRGSLYNEADGWWIIGYDHDHLGTWRGDYIDALAQLLHLTRELETL